MGLTVMFTRLDPRAQAPEQQHTGDSGWDLRALEPVEIDDLPATSRGQGGFGHTGL